MTKLHVRAFGGLFFFLIALSALVFLPAWSLDYWQAWVFLFVMAVLTLAVTLYLMIHDPKLLERRVNAGPLAEKEKNQKVIQSFSTVAFLAIIIAPVLDHRFGWSHVSPSIVALGEVLIFLGFLIIFFVFRENTFTSGTIEVHEAQEVIATGPYAWVRHPMYVGGLIFLGGVPLALGSYWGLIMFVPIAGVIMWRLIDEETFLEKNLPGYVEYKNKVRYRLIPFVW
jgi:protein-S-isoprenylcysteine O-methyltransferase Ste14